MRDTVRGLAVPKLHAAAPPHLEALEGAHVLGAQGPPVGLPALGGRQYMVCLRERAEHLGTDSTPQACEVVRTNLNC
jgi:hypothetical protein